MKNTNLIKANLGLLILILLIQPFFSIANNFTNSCDTITYFADNDNDGFGDLGNSMESCNSEVPANYVSNWLDCDDDDLLFTTAGSGSVLSCNYTCPLDIILTTLVEGGTYEHAINSVTVDNAMVGLTDGNIVFTAENYLTLNFGTTVMLETNSYLILSGSICPD